MDDMRKGIWCDVANAAVNAFFHETLQDVVKFNQETPKEATV